MSICVQSGYLRTGETSDLNEQTAHEDTTSTAQPTESRIQRNRQSSLS
jgi:hypothetical protein